MGISPTNANAQQGQDRNLVGYEYVMYVTAVRLSRIAKPVLNIRRHCEMAASPAGTSDVSAT